MEFTTGGGKEMQYGIEYEPRIEDPVIIIQFNTLAEAEQHMEWIKAQSLKSYQFHRIVELQSESDAIKEAIQLAHWEEVSR
jgi:hypothetical protein